MKSREIILEISHAAPDFSQLLAADAGAPGHLIAGSELKPNDFV